MRETDRQIKTEQEIKRERISEAERERERVTVNAQ